MSFFLLNVCSKFSCHLCVKLCHHWENASHQKSLRYHCVPCSIPDTVRIGEYAGEWRLHLVIWIYSKPKCYAQVCAVWKQDSYINSSEEIYGYVFWEVQGETYSILVEDKILQSKREIECNIQFINSPFPNPLGGFSQHIWNFWIESEIFFLSHSPSQMPQDTCLPTKVLLPTHIWL